MGQAVGTGEFGVADVADDEERPERQQHEEDVPGPELAPLPRAGADDRDEDGSALSPEVIHRRHAVVGRVADNRGGVLVAGARLLDGVEEAVLPALGGATVNAVGGYGRVARVGPG